MANLNDFVPRYLVPAILTKEQVRKAQITEKAEREFTARFPPPPPAVSYDEAGCWNAYRDWDDWRDRQQEYVCIRLLEEGFVLSRSEIPHSLNTGPMTDPYRHGVKGFVPKRKRDKYESFIRMRTLYERIFRI